MSELIEPRPWPPFDVPDDVTDGAVLHEHQGWRWTWHPAGVACSM